MENQMIILATLLTLNTFAALFTFTDVLDHGSYVHESTHATLEECQLVTHGTASICVGDMPSYLYSNDETADIPEDFNAEMKFTKCDYWAGCYSHRPLTRTGGN